MAVLSNVFALTAFWAIYRIIQDVGWFAGFLALALASMIFKIGPAPLFVAAASFLHFKFRAVGMWLPLFSCLWGLFTLVAQLLLAKGASSVREL
jgi:hypothetical protein